MKTKYLFLLLMLFIAASSCEDDSKKDIPSLDISQSVFDNLSRKGNTLKVNITSSEPWTATTDATWCTLSPQKGERNQPLSIIVEGNIEQTPRTATITVSSTNAKSKTIQINQEAAQASDEEYHYELPVIFHVLYKDPSDHLQYVSRDRLAYILDYVNLMYQNNPFSVDMNLTFKLATIDPEGNPLASPGVEYIQWPEDYPIHCDKFMQDESGKYVKYLWDPNKYINVMIYNFYADNPNSTTLGISHIPFTTKGVNSLPGLNEVENSYLESKNLKFPYCASINSLCIDYESDKNNYDPRDIIVTLAHELGHYLGLHHVFTETITGDLIESCKDTDYCEDTPSYNKKEYDAEYIWVMSGLSDLREHQYFDYLVKRQDCSNQQFISRNIMDYSVSYCDQFTSDQRDRIRHVLTYSPLIPGPKKGQAKTRSAVQGPLDLPLLIRK